MQKISMSMTDIKIMKNINDLGILKHKLGIIT